MVTSSTATKASGVLVATCLSTLVVNANTSAVSILLPAISEDTGTSVDTLQWAVTGCSLMGAAVIVTSGSLGDVFGRKRVFQFGLLLFVASCVFIALAQTGEMVIAGRVIQGAAGSTILACGLSLPRGPSSRRIWSIGVRCVPLDCRHLDPVARKLLSSSSYERWREAGEVG